MVELQSTFEKVYWTLAAGGLAYLGFIFSLTVPTIQRWSASIPLLEMKKAANLIDSALYAHKINPSLWQDVNDVEPFGFLSMSSFQGPNFSSPKVAL